VGLQFRPQEHPRYQAHLEHGLPPRRNRPDSAFREWWQETVIVDQSDKSFSREKLVLTLANKEGGAHVDPKIDAEWVALTRDNSLGWVTGNGDDQRPMKDAELHSVRQIAFELLLSLEKAGVI
jgi:hypothetical protein